jgi:hypothetical protein
MSDTGFDMILLAARAIDNTGRRSQRQAASAIAADEAATHIDTRNVNVLIAALNYMKRCTYDTETDDDTDDE